MKGKPDRQANLAFMWMFAPIATIAIGFVAANVSAGWDSIAYFFMMLYVSAALCIVPVVFGVLALKGGTNLRPNALLAILVPLTALFIYLVTLGGMAN